MPMNLMRGNCLFIKGKALSPSQRLTEHSSQKNFGSSERLFQGNKNSIVGKLVFKGKINSG